MTWYVNHDTTWVGPASAVAAGAVFQDGWIDETGNGYTVDSSNYLLGSTSAGLLARPVSEALQDAQVTYRSLYSTTVQAAFHLRALNANAYGTSAYSSYYAFFSNGTINVKKFVANTPSVIGTQAVSGLTAGTAYDFTFSAVQTNSTTTTLTFTIANTSGTQLGTYTVTDTTASLQNVSGQQALQTTVATELLSRVRTFTDIAATGYTFTGPTAGLSSAASTNFTVALNGGSAAAVTFTPSVTSGPSGTFTPTSVTVPAGSAQAQTFTFTPAAGGGTSTIAISSGGAYTDPSPLTYKSITWYTQHATTWTGGPVAAVAAGAVLQDGWTDLTGGMFSIDSSNNLDGALTGGGSGGLLYRPVNEATVDKQIVAHVIYNSVRTIFLTSRVNLASGGNTGYYMGVYPSGGIEIKSLVAGVSTTLGIQAVTLTSGTAYIYTFQTIQSGSGQTTLIGTVSTSGGTVIQSITLTDTTASLQNLAGTTAVNITSTGATGGDVSSITTYVDAIASTYAIGGATHGVTGTASNAITVTLNGAITGANVTITPSDASGGTFSPTTLTFTVGGATSQNVVYTPSSTGSKTLSFSSAGALTDPAGYAYLSQPTPVTLGVTSLAFKFDPGVWKSDTGTGGPRQGSAYRQAWPIGAGGVVVWNAASQYPTAQLLLPTTTTLCTLAIFLNGVLNDAIPATGTIELDTLAGFAAGAVNTARFIITAGSNSEPLKWNNGGSYVQIQGLKIDGNSSAGTAPIARPWCYLVGDSQGEGFEAISATQGSFIQANFFSIMQALDSFGYDCGAAPCLSSGWIEPGNSPNNDVPAWCAVSGSSGGSGGTYSESTSRWDKIDQGVPILDSNGQISSYGATGTSPALIIVDYINNDCAKGGNISDTQASITLNLSQLRTSAPNALIVLVVPAGLYYTPRYPTGPSFITALRNAITAYLTANPGDLKVKLIDTGSTLATTVQNGPFINTDGTHFTARGNQLITGAKIQQLIQFLQTPIPRYRYQ